MKDVDLVFCKDCVYFTRRQMKTDGSEDLRYKKSWCMWNRRIKDADGYCSDAIREEGDA